MIKEFYPKPSGWRVSLSIGVGVGWLIFLLLWLAFYAVEYSGYENVAIVLVSILVAFIILGGSWASWGLRYIPKEGKEMMRAAGFTTRVVASIIVPLALFIFWIIWFFFYAKDFNIYQNIAIFLVSILAVGGILGGTWSSWGMRHGKDFENLCEKEDEKKD